MLGLRSFAVMLIKNDLAQHYGNFVLKVDGYSAYFLYLVSSTGYKTGVNELAWAIDTVDTGHIKHGGAPPTEHHSFLVFRSVKSSSCLNKIQRFGYSLRKPYGHGLLLWKARKLC